MVRSRGKVLGTSDSPWLESLHNSNKFVFHVNGRVIERGLYKRDGKFVAKNSMARFLNKERIKHQAFWYKVKLISIKCFHHIPTQCVFYWLQTSCNSTLLEDFDFMKKTSGFSLQKLLNWKNLVTFSSQSKNTPTTLQRLVDFEASGRGDNVVKGVVQVPFKRLKAFIMYCMDFFSKMKITKNNRIKLI